MRTEEGLYGVAINLSPSKYLVFMVMRPKLLKDFRGLLMICHPA